MSSSMQTSYQAPSAGDMAGPYNESLTACSRTLALIVDAGRRWNCENKQILSEGGSGIYAPEIGLLHLSMIMHTQ
jgi:hypothetical protein